MATVQTTDSGGIAQVTFRVRCENLGHGEAIFLSQADNPSGSRVSKVCSFEFSF